MNKREWMQSVANMAGDFWDQMKEIEEDLADDDEPSLEARSDASLLSQFAGMLTDIYLPQATEEAIEAVKSAERLANPYR